MDLFFNNIMRHLFYFILIFVPFCQAQNIYITGTLSTEYQDEIISKVIKIIEENHKYVGKEVIYYYSADSLYAYYPKSIKKGLQDTIVLWMNNRQDLKSIRYCNSMIEQNHLGFPYLFKKSKFLTDNKRKKYILNLGGNAYIYNTTSYKKITQVKNFYELSDAISSNSNSKFDVDILINLPYELIKENKEPLFLYPSLSKSNNLLELCKNNQSAKFMIKFKDNSFRKKEDNQYYIELAKDDTLNLLSDSPYKLEDIVNNGNSIYCGFISANRIFKSRDGDFCQIDGMSQYYIRLYYDIKSTNVFSNCAESRIQHSKWVPIRFFSPPEGDLQYSPDCNCFIK
jgi:hypothetical protein